MTDGRGRLTALEWRLYIVAVLGAIYIVTWRMLEGPRDRAIGSPPPAVVTETPPRTAPAHAPSSRGVPGDLRGSPSRPQRLVRQPARQPVRVQAPRRARTRSS